MREEVSCKKKKKKKFWLNNLAILYGLCILDISFLHWPAGVVSDKHCLLSFFSIFFNKTEMKIYVRRFNVLDHSKKPCIIPESNSESIIKTTDIHVEKFV